MLGVEVKLEQIRVIEALRGLNETNLEIGVDLILAAKPPRLPFMPHPREEEIWHRLHQKLFTRDHVRVKSSNQRGLCLSQRVVEVSALGFLIVLKRKITHTKLLRELCHRRTVSVVSNIDMHLALVRIIHIRQGVHGFIKQLDRLVVGRDNHVHIRIPALWNLRQRQIDFVGAVFSIVEFKCAECGGDFAHQQQNTEDDRDNSAF
ncbi:hypothetical protein SDC9_151975 [bioreactor metagenome]|uniref:Uncharacterized protein n=1 Tax=bioreactor metagenome TaxID=1076179 RepID=A0A645ETI0_9ZZZZ